MKKNTKEPRSSVMDTIKTVEDALKATGRPAVPEFSEVPEDLRAYFQAQYKAVVIAEALNGKWKADWADRNQQKWYPWFTLSSSGFAFYDTNDYYSNPLAGDASRLCFESDALATYAGKQFIDVWQALIMK